MEAIDVTRCCACGTDVYLTRQRMADLRATGNTFYCSNGHSLTFKPTALEKENAALKRDIEAMRLQRNNAEADLAAERAKRTCPHCKRGFQSAHGMRIHKALKHRSAA